MRPAQADRQLSGALSLGSWLYTMGIWSVFYYFLGCSSVIGCVSYVSEWQSFSSVSLAKDGLVTLTQTQPAPDAPLDWGCLGPACQDQSCGWTSPGVLTMIARCLSATTIRKL